MVELWLKLKIVHIGCPALKTHSGVKKSSTQKVCPPLIYGFKRYSKLVKVRFIRPFCVRSYDTAAWVIVNDINRLALSRRRPSIIV